MAALRPFLIFYFCSAAGQNKKHLKITKTAVIFKESNKTYYIQESEKHGGGEGSRHSIKHSRNHGFLDPLLLRLHLQTTSCFLRG